MGSVTATASIGAATTRNAAANGTAPARRRSYVGRSARRSHSSHTTTSTGSSLSGWYVYMAATEVAAPARIAVPRPGRVAQCRSAISASAPKSGTIVLRMPSRLTATSHSEPAAQAAAATPVQTPNRRARWPIASTPATPKAAAVARSARAVAPAKWKTPATT